MSPSNAATTFWVIYTSDGQVHILGYQEQARISHPVVPSQNAVWLIESSVSSTGEQIFWQYRAEDDTSCSPSEIAAHSDSAAQRYPVAIWYGNKKRGVLYRPSVLLQFLLTGCLHWSWTMVSEGWM